MKELTIEQKAKRYDEAIKKFKPIYDLAKEQGRTIDVKEFERIFPELKESEDEEIRKWLIEMVEVVRKANPTNADHNGMCSEAVAWLEKQSTPQVRTGLEWVNTIDDACDKRYSEEYAHGEYCHEQSFKWGFQEGVDWLEKQGEQKPAIIIPKFRVGDEIKTTNEAPLTITKITDSGYWSEDLFICSFENSAKWELVGKLVDKVEPKFHEGDWIIHYGTENIYKVVAIIDNQYQLKYGDNYTVQNCTDVDRCARLWDIAKDAKDGDVLATDDGSICVFDGTVEDGKYPFAYYGLTEYGFESYDRKLPFTHDDVHPATKEQRDLLFKKMKEAGYVWNAEKKELKKTEEEFNGEDYGVDSLWHARNILERTLGKVEGYQTDDGILEHKCAISAVKQLAKQNNAWSEEDEETLKILDRDLQEFYSRRKAQAGSPLFESQMQNVRWLKSLKDRVQPQPKQEWSEEDELHIRGLESLVRQEWAIAERENDKDKIYKMRDLSFFLKTLKPQLKKELSEEEEQLSKIIISDVLRIRQKCGIGTEEWDIRSNALNWFKSLILRKQWKPTMEQLTILSNAIELRPLNESDGTILMSLYYDLKKLTE